MEHVVNTKKKSNLLLALPWISCVLLVAAMVGASEFFNEKEILFPEIAALAIGYIVAPRRSWKVNSVRMWFLITGCACLGLLIVKYARIPLFWQICLAFTVAQVLYAFSSTTLAPFVSAIVLPVILRTDTIIYPISAGILTFIVILLHHIFIAAGIREDEEFIPCGHPSGYDLFAMANRIMCTAILTYCALKLHMIYIVAPPLLVAFTEFSRPWHKARKRPFKVIMYMTCAALVGSFLRYFLTMRLGLPLFVSATVAMTALLFIVRETELYMPPSGAVLILSFLIPECGLLMFPVQIFIGIYLIMGTTLIMFREKTIEENAKHRKSHHENA